VVVFRRGSVRKVYIFCEWKAEIFHSDIRNLIGNFDDYERKKPARSTKSTFSVSGDGEFHSDLGLRFDRLPRLLVRLKSPLLDGFKRGGKKHLWTTDYLEALNLPILAYSSQQHNRPFDRLWLR
jgi:hypothetical protein